MSGPVTTKYDDVILAFVVLMPRFITLHALMQWKSELLESLREMKGNEKAALLIDTNSHQFESIECQKLLRGVFSDREIIRRISRTAFVVPRQYREPEIVDSTEGYFSRFEDAYRWLS